MSTTVKKIRSFTAYDDSGQRWVLDIFMEYAQTGHGAIPGVTIIRTRTRLDVVRKEKGKYEVLTATDPHPILHSDDPDAP